MPKDQEEISLVKPFPIVSKLPGRSCRPQAHTFSRPSPSDFPPLFPGESLTSRTLRADAFCKVWEALLERLDKIHPTVNQPTFHDVESFVLKKLTSGFGEVPIGVLYARGVNPSDHASTLCALSEFLKGRDASVCFFTSRELKSRPGGFQTVFQKICREFCGELEEEFPTGVDFFWLMGKLLERSEQGRSPASESKKRKAEAGSKPLVIVVENVERVDSGVLKDLVVALSDVRLGLPVTMLVGMSTDGGALKRCLPGDARNRVECTPFELASSRQAMEQLFKTVLLAHDAPMVVLGKDLAMTLTDQHLHHDSTIQGFKQGLLMACTEHFGSQVLSGFLKVLPTPSESKEWDLVSRELDKVSAERLSLEEKEDVERLLDSCVVDILGWRVGLLWIHQLAVGLGNLTRGSGCTLRDLYCTAVTQGLRNSTALAMVDGLAENEGLSKLSNTDVSNLLKQLKATADEYLPMCSKLEPYIKELQKFCQQLEAPSAPSPVSPRSNESTVLRSGKLKQNSKQNQSVPAVRKSLTAQNTMLKSVKARRNFLLSSLASHAQTKVPDANRSSLSVAIATFLGKAIRELSGDPPEDMQGSQVFCLKGGKAVRTHLLGTPRFSLEEALLKPQLYLSKKFKSTPDEDLCVAYQILTAAPGDRVNLADWFVSFASHFGEDVHVKALDSPRKKSKCEGGVQSPSKKKKKSKDQGGGPNSSISLSSPELLARFERVLLELQHIGFVKKIGDLAKCNVFND